MTDCRRRFSLMMSSPAMSIGGKMVHGFGAAAVAGGRRVGEEDIPTVARRVLYANEAIPNHCRRPHLTMPSPFFNLAAKNIYFMAGAVAGAGVGST